MEVRDTYLFSSAYGLRGYYAEFIAINHVDGIGFARVVEPGTEDENPSLVSGGSYWCTTSAHGYFLRDCQTLPSRRPQRSQSLFKHPDLEERMLRRPGQTDERKLIENRKLGGDITRGNKPEARSLR